MCYRTSLYAFCYRMIGDRQKAEDIVHESFMHLFEDCDSIRHPPALRAWLFRVARNEMLMEFRRRGFPIDDSSGIVTTDSGPDDMLIMNEERDLVRRGLETLTPPYREVLILREFDQLSYAEIAEITFTTESAVKSKIFKARRALARILAPWMQEGGTHGL